MSNVESLDGQTFLSYLVDSFINVFQLQVYISVSFPKRTVQWGGVRGSGGWGLEVSVGSHLGGATCRGLVSLPCSYF